MWQDESTQVLAALAALAHVPGARTAAMIGHGSGVPGHYLLATPDPERLVTIEIEPETIQASLLHYPVNRRAQRVGRPRCGLRALPLRARALGDWP